MEETEANKQQTPKTRKRKKATKNCMLTVRMTETEKLLISGKAQRAGLGVASWLRAAAKNAEVIARFSPEDAALLRKLTGMSNILHQISLRAQQEGLLSHQHYCRQILKEIHQLLTYLNRDDR